MCYQKIADKNSTKTSLSTKKFWSSLSTCRLTLADERKHVFEAAIDYYENLGYKCVIPVYVKQNSWCVDMEKKW